MRTRACTLLWCVSVLVACLPVSVLGFSTTGATWLRNSTVLSLNRTSFPADNVFNDNAQFAMSDWNAVIGSTFEFFVDSTNCNPTNSFPLSDNCVAFVSGNSLNGALGVTTSRSNILGIILNADVRFDVNAMWVPDLNVNDFSFGPPFSFRGVARHEFGHVLGLCHEDRTGIVALMNSVYTAGGVKPANPHWDDRRGIRTLYPGSGSERDLIAYMWKKSTGDVQGCGSSMTVSTPVGMIPASAKPGDTVAVEFSLQNAGNRDVGTFNLGFFLSTNTTISTSDVLIGEIMGGSVDAHGRGTFTRNVSIPSNTPLGAYFLGICLDHDNRVAESNEQNNCAVAPGSISIR